MIQDPLKEKESVFYELVPETESNYTQEHSNRSRRTGQVPALHLPEQNKADVASKNLTTDSTRISSNSLGLPGLSLDKNGFSQKAMKSSHSIVSNSGIILRPEFHLFCKHLSKILNCLYDLESKKEELLSHKSFNLEAIFLRIINNENNSQTLCQSRSFNFEAFRGFLRELGIQGNMIKSVIDLFSAFDQQHQCFLGFAEFKMMMLPASSLKNPKLHSQGALYAQKMAYDAELEFKLSKVLQSLISLK